MSNHLAAAFRTRVNRFLHQRENGYINHAMATLTSTNMANVHAAYLIRPMVLRRPRHASATDTKAANNSIAEKWLICIA